MTKRFENFQESSSKKFRNDDLWGDDFDMDAVEDCFRRATQVCQNQLNNESILPSYSFFRKQEKQFTSTQVQNDASSLKEIQTKYAEKEGEVSILRSNLNELRESLKNEQDKSHREWMEKMANAQRENKSIRSELEFKKLEVINLKQQVADLSKLAAAEQCSTKRKKNLDSKPDTSTKPIDAVKEENSKVSINYQRYFPLKCSKISKTLDEHLQELLETKFTDHKMNTNENINSFCLEFYYLSSLSSDEINSDKTHSTLDKLTNLSLQLLNEFYDYVKKMEDNIQFQEIHHADSIYFRNFSKYEPDQDTQLVYNLNEKILVLKLRNIIRLLAELLPFSNYLYNNLLSDRSHNTNKPTTFNKSSHLNLILGIVRTLGRIRKTEAYSDFLCAVVRFLNQALSYNKLDHVMDLICQITKELLFARPNVEVIESISLFFKSASHSTQFLNSLCSKSTNAPKVNLTKGILYFTKDSCMFHIYGVLLENLLLKMGNEFSIDIGVNIIDFIYNVLKSNPIWLYQDAEQECECRFYLYKISIEVVRITLIKYDKAAGNSRNLLKNIILISNLLLINFPELIQKHVVQFAQYKEVVRLIMQLNCDGDLSESDLNTLERLNLSESIPEISINKLEGIEF